MPRGGAWCPAAGVGADFTGSVPPLRGPRSRHHRSPDRGEPTFHLFGNRDDLGFRWNIAKHTFSAIDATTIDMARLAASPCPSPDATAGDDCRLRALIDTYGPGRAALDGEGSVPAEREAFPVLYFDMPGFDERTWRAEYGADYRARYGSVARTFAHPFIAEIPATDTAPGGFEFVIQFWFFYPVNDGPNNHEGDWEHINVVISPLNKLAAPLDPATVERLVSGQLPLEGDHPLVIKRLEYYFHHYVTPLDFSHPNAYQPRQAWQREVDAMDKNRTGDRDVLARVRRRAWRDAGETVINTRPVVWIGGDGIGIQNVLETPGLKDRDGHASYPFRGYYKRIGTGEVSERVVQAFDHVEYFANPTGSWPRVEDYGDPSRIALTPDWEHVLELVKADPVARREWSWLVLPVRFGYPASPSPAAGVIAHVDTGNVAVVGPAYNDGWNRVGDTVGYARYDLGEVSWARPLGLFDSFFPRLGFLNAPILYFMIKPPLDLIWRTAALPVRAAVGSRQPTFLPASAPARRAVSLETGPMMTSLSEDLLALFFTRDQFPEILTRVVGLLPPGASDFGAEPRFGWAAAASYGVVFHVSPRFSTESSLVIYDANLGFDITSPQLTSPIRVRGDFHQFEYQGVLRFNLKTGAFQPYLKYGHGITSYQLKNVAVEGALISNPTSPRFRPPSTWRNLGFNETILGGGVDWEGLRLGRMWLGVKGSYTFIRHPIGFEREAAVEEIDQLATELAGKTFGLSRHQLRAMVTLGF